MSEPEWLAVTGALVSCLCMAILWAVQRYRCNASLADIGWTALIGGLALFYVSKQEGYLPRRLLLGGMGFVWAVRLGFYLTRDRFLSDVEDGRYRMLREAWGPAAQSRFFWFFQGQALLVSVFSLPFLVIARRGEMYLDGWDWGGVLLWVTGLVGSSAADRQLSKFRADPANVNRTCCTGLWRYSRHPNYFFEWVHWWAYAVMAVPVGLGWLVWLVPLLLLWLLWFVTGIPYSEKRALVSRGENYRRYQSCTSVFIPWFPRKESL